MVRKFFKRYLPKRDALMNDSSLQLGFLRKHLDKNNLWHFHCQPVAKGVAAGLLAAFIPLPIQTICAVILVILIGGNIIVAVAMTWVSNPVTFVPINYLIYKVGNLILGLNGEQMTLPDSTIKFTSIHAFWSSSLEWLSHFGKAFFVGLPFVAITAAILGYIIVMIICYVMAYLQSLRKENDPNE